jgi:tetratricopeptide (TPR) repeat protein
MVLMANGYYAEAVPCFAQAEVLDGAEPRWPYYRGVALTLGDPDAAIPALRRAVDLFGAAEPAPRLRLAEVLLGQGQPGQAEALFRQVLAHEPDSARARLGLARLALARGEPARCRGHLAACTGSPLTARAAHTLLAEVCLRGGDRAGADAALRRAGSLPDDPEPPDPWVEEVAELRVGRQAQLARASRLVREGRGAQAAALLRQTVRDYPGSASAWLGLGRALLQQGDAAAAERALRRGARLDPGLVEVQFYLGAALFEQGRAAAAAAFFRRATALRPDYAVAWYNLGQCLKGQGDRTGAADAFRRALRHKPHFIQPRVGLAELLLRDGRRPEAVAQLEQALKMDPGNSHIRDLLKKARP